MPAPVGVAPKSKQERREPLACKGFARNGPTDMKPQREGVRSQARGGGNSHRALEDVTKRSLN